jgi:hypothetical protein
MVVWMATRWALSRLVADPAVRDRLRSARIYEILRPGQQPLPGLNAVPVISFSAVSDAATALAGATCPWGAQAVLYDPEAWPFTPAAEQQDPVSGTARVAALAHARGLSLIAAPALSLTTVLAPASKAPRWQRFLELGLAGAIARHVDGIELQAQSLERDAAVYAAFVGAAASQARSANPGVPVLAGLSTNPPGDPVTSQQLIAAVQATRLIIDGYWLNIPGRGPRCPACNPPNPRVGVELLRAVL